MESPRLAQGHQAEAVLVVAGMEVMVVVVAGAVAGAELGPGWPGCALWAAEVVEGVAEEGPEGVCLPLLKSSYSRPN